MKTPYDAAIRVCRQHLDNIRVQAAQKAEEVEQLDAARDAVQTKLRCEADLVREDFMPFVNFGAYAQRMRNEAAVLDGARMDARAQLDVLVESTQEAFGDFKTLDTAASNWQDGKAREAGRREQNTMDELAGQSFDRARAA
jgi:hypothetical protein